MRLVHRTYYWGTHIDPANSIKDSDIDANLIWTQALPDHQSRDCCRGFGERAVGITDSDLNEWSDGAEWGLWLVSTKWGRSPGHFFWKMALIPSDCEYDFDTYDWTYVGQVDGYSSPLQDLQEHLWQYWQSDRVDADVFHVHIGLYTRERSLFAGRGQSGFADEPTIYSCSECSREFSSSDYSSAFAAHEAKEQHERDAHPQWDVYTCDDCGREFSEENYASSQTACFAMEQHVRDAHPRWDVYTCDDCGREFSEQNYSCSNSAYEAREQHMRDVHGSYY